jgi:hypothetical protein
MFNRIYTATSVVLTLIVTCVLLLASCSGSDANAQCQAQAAKLPSGMVAAWTVQNGECLVQLNYMDGTPGEWFKASDFIK